jgi:hypothetical protein
MHKDAAQRYHELISEAPDLATREHWLDQYADALLRATEWDADQWGLPTEEMKTPLGAILSKAGGEQAELWPREVV